MTNLYAQSGARTRAFHLGPLLVGYSEAVTAAGFINAHVYTLAAGRVRVQVRIGRRPFRRLP